MRFGEHSPADDYLFMMQDSHWRASEINVGISNKSLVMYAGVLAVVLVSMVMMLVAVQEDCQADQRTGSTVPADGQAGF